MQRKKKIMSECNFIGLKNNRLHYKCKRGNDKSFKSINILNKKFPNTYQFCNGNLNKLVLLLRKGVYAYKYTDNLRKFDETSLPDKEVFYSKLNEEGISNADYTHAKKVWEVFEIKNLGVYHDLYVQSDTLLHAHVFETFRNKSIQIYELDPAHFLSVPGLHGKLVLKKQE